MGQMSNDTDKAELSSWEQWEKSPLAGTRSGQTDAVYGFKARWQLATSLHELTLRGYSTDSTVPDGYHALLKVDIVCTAAEQLARVIEYPKDKCFLVVEDPDTAKWVRDILEISPSSKIVENLLKSARGKAVKNLIRFSEGASSDLMHLMRPLRNGASHGTSTPTGLGLGTKGVQSQRKVSVVMQLCDAVLEHCDDRFTDFVNQTASATFSCE